jgi:ubiquinone biosynthesis protein
MDFLQGMSISDSAGLNAAGMDLDDVARRGANMFVEMIFRDGFYHADPHPGNLMILSGDVIGVLDCGMVGRIDDDLREQVEDMLLAAVDQDAARLTSIVVKLGRVPAGLDRDQLQTEIDEFVSDYRDQSIEEFDLSGALNGIVAIIRRHQIILPARMALLLKVLVMLEGTSRQLSPRFSLAELLRPYREKAIQRRLSPQRMWRKLQTAYRDWNHLLEILPEDLSDILSRMKSGSFDIHLEHRRLEAMINRLVLGIITAALFVGSATLWSREVPPVIGGYSLPGVLGCVLAVFLGWRVTRAIKRSGEQ